MDECLLCGSDSRQHIPFEILIENELEFEYQICRSCGLVFRKDLPSNEQLEAFYLGSYRETVQGQEGPSIKDRWVQEARARSVVSFLKSHLSHVNKHLDIGSSSGDLVLQISREFGCVSIGIEPGDAYREFSSSRGVQVSASLDDLDSAAVGTFDLITMSHVLEHLPAPRTYLVEIRERWLTEDGSLLIEVPNLFGHPALELSHLTAYVPKTIQQLLESAGYETVVLKTHGHPYSRLLKMFITVIAVPVLDSRTRESRRPHIRWMKIQRKMGLSILYGARAISSRLLRKGQLEPWVGG